MAYTKYSLTPANNTAAPPDGAPEGMLPSAVNDTMRDMMAQIRDVGDGVRDGTYTMTAPKITGGTITGVVLTGNTLTNPVITGATLTTSAFNGTVGATTASTGAFTTLSTSSTTTLSGLTASTALALDASKNVVSVTNTGTGSNVLSASPTLTGTIAGASLSLSSLTSGRVTYAGASGLLSDSANLTFDGTKLTSAGLVSTGALNVSGGGWGVLPYVANSLVVDSNVGETRLFATGTNTSTQGNFLFYTGTTNGTASERMRITSAGNVGIGTSSPSQLLHLNVASGSVYEQISSGANNVYIGFDSARTVGTIQSNNALTFDVGSSYTPRMTIDTSGNLGIGATSPVAKLHIKGSGTSGQVTASFILENSSSGTGGMDITGSAGASRWRFLYGGGPSTGTNALTEAMCIGTEGTNAGNVGIGTSSPSGKLQIDSANVDPSATATGITLINSTSSQATSNGGSISLGGVYTGSSITQFGYILGAKANSTDGNYAGYLSFGTRPNGDVSQERMRIDSSGNLLVGTTSTITGTKFGATSTTTSGAGEFYVNSAGADAVNAINIIKYSTTNTTAQQFIGFTINNANTGSGQINANGASQAAFGSFSDARLKENIVDLPSQLNNILALKPKEFDYIQSEGGGHQIGFVAQDMQTVYPDAISERTDGMLVVTGWSKTEARLVKAIQEQQALIESLTTRLTALENK